MRNSGTTKDNERSLRANWMNSQSPKKETESKARSRKCEARNDFSLIHSGASFSVGHCYRGLSSNLLSKTLVTN